MFPGPNGGVGRVTTASAGTNGQSSLVWGGIQGRDLQDGGEMPEDSHLQTVAWRGGSDRLCAGLPASNTQSPLDMAARLQAGR